MEIMLQTVKHYENIKNKPSSYSVLRKGLKRCEIKIIQPCPPNYLKHLTYETIINITLFSLGHKIKLNILLKISMAAFLDLAER